MNDADAPLDSTLSLLTRAKAGDTRAMDDLFARYQPGLRRWARGRLPRWARDLSDTPDLVQEAMAETFKRIGAFEYRGEDGLLAYMRLAVLNRIRLELRRARCRPEAVELTDGVIDPGLSPLEAALGREQLHRYEAALDRLDTSDRELVIGRIELGLTFAALAASTGRPSADAARMAVTRALVRLADILRTHGSAAV